MRGEHALQALTYTNVPWANALPVVNFLAASNHDGGDAEVGIMIQSALTDVAAWRFPATYGAGAQTISAPLQNVTAPVSSLLPTNTDVAGLVQAGLVRPEQLKDEAYVLSLKSALAPRRGLRRQR